MTWKELRDKLIALGNDPRLNENISVCQVGYETIHIYPEELYTMPGSLILFEKVV